ncbi:ATP-binding protein [Actinokineospora auranticolor]|uniref:histidine kinase n=1 Tax=Actinokineospora auranticolor TaxID=155976 RepID=A0A2S6GNL6_9PSEU|nr:PAS domain-containing sensor histidine kinase [Actinokineospora auranticolor]PPK66824.1 signal transduction histidine kinase [Actinokineospora auranticolor]
MDFALLFAATPSPYLVLGPDLVIVEVNPAYLAATATKREELLGKHLFTAFPDNPELVGADGVRNLRRSLETVLATGLPDTMPLQRYDIPVGPGGEFVERHWSPVNTPLIGADGAIAYILHRVEDVTELVVGRTGDEHLRASLERMRVDLFVRSRELKAANDRLAEAGAALRAEHLAKDRFFAAVSHELRNCLGALRAAAEVLSLDVGEHPALAVLERQVDGLNRMTGDLLDAGRVLTGALRVDRLPVRMRDLVRAGVAAVELGGRAVAVTLPDSPVRVLGDQVRLDQVLRNLLANAVRHSPVDTAIAVSLATRPGEAVLEVSDTGAGFDPATAESLFEAFTRAPGARGSGLGLGLLVVRGVVALHGGAVTAHSDGPGTGARFRVTLPLEPSTPDVPAGRAEPVHNNR